MPLTVGNRVVMILAVMYYQNARRLHPSFAQRFRRWEKAFGNHGITVDSPSNDGYLLRIVVEGCQLIFPADALPFNSAASQLLARDKLATYQVLTNSGIPVPAGIVFFAKEHRGMPTRVEECLLYDTLAERLLKQFPDFSDNRQPLVVKPGRESYRTGVQCCRTLHGILKAAREVLPYCYYGFVQEFIPPDEYRIVILDEVVLLKYLKHGTPLTGDGRSTQNELIEAFNARVRRNPSDEPLIDIANLPPLKGREWVLTNMPQKGEVLEVALETSELSQGSYPEIVEEVPGDILQIALCAHRTLGLRYSGIDIRLPVGTEASVILEVNGNPGYDWLEIYEPELVENVTEQLASKIIELARPTGSDTSLLL